MASDFDFEAVGWIRTLAKDVTGTNCTFVDDDLKVLAFLAQKAIAAGLTDGLDPGGLAILAAKPGRWPVKPIKRAPLDRRLLVYVPQSGTSEGHWIFARWFVDLRPSEEQAGLRRALIEKHGGYWSAHFKGGKPLKRMPTLWMDLPDPEAS